MRHKHDHDEPSDTGRPPGRARRTPRRARAAAALLGLLLAAAAGGPRAAAAAGPPVVVDLPVTFQVSNTNTSGLPCPSDGARYTVRGSLVGPSAALAGAGPRAVTLYVHGFDFGGESTFHFRPVPAYDYAARMAKLGQTSLVIDRLGYDSSGLPQGMQTCIGSAADVLHQIVTAIRGGTYELGGRTPLSFSKVVLAGHDIGGEIAEVEAYSYRDVNGLIVLDFADTGLTPTLLQWSIQGFADCAQGGKESRPGGPGGYFDLGPPSDQLAPLAFPNADPRLVAALRPYRRRNPCGDLSSAPAGFSTDMARLGEVMVPVLIAAGDTDVAFSSDGVRRQQSFYTGTNDVTVAILANTGHFPMFERTAPRFRAIVSHWLRTRVGPPCAEAQGQEANGGEEGAKEGRLPPRQGEAHGPKGRQSENAAPQCADSAPIR